MALTPEELLEEVSDSCEAFEEWWEAQRMQVSEEEAWRIWQCGMAYGLGYAHGIVEMLKELRGEKH